MHACDLPVGQDLDVEADANITVESSESLYPQQIFSISSWHLPLVPGAATCPDQRPGSLYSLSLTAGDLERSKGTAQEDPIHEQREFGP